ncbi:putative regulator of chromosome condensation 1/beta-lactamase-inhibitor protein II [Lupinus albus]|uniref:Putative regulator of chromosome condensation 1/beta-lactamase-inhibitor protein II n=1 Tax=Lupinus albus TaxID=3870 RepID=A0A6A4PML5_LUPAL|nr:putative regulator of chromosome condensation 1/beta-lactamase-inhibitor protein II [Lupinus albus]
MMMVDEVMSGVTNVAQPRRVLLVSAGASHSVALLSGNVVCSWGRGEDGQLGHGDSGDRLLPTKLSALDDKDITSLTCGADHTIAYSESGREVYSWGWGDFGRLGHGDYSDLLIPHPIRSFQALRIKQIACGDSHCLAVTMENEVLSWGRNQNGQLGLGTTEDAPLPQKIQTFQGVPIKMVAAGAEHSAAITEDGDSYGWGWGRYGNLGLGDRNDRLIPVKVTVDGEKMAMVACGWRHTISVSSSGRIYTHGWGKYGQLGHGDFEDYLVPYKIQALSIHFISQVAGGWRHSMALTSSGLLFGWGWNKCGQIGVGDNFDRSSPMQVNFPHEEKIVQITCGWRHNIAITECENVYSWGRGANGQLGHGETIDRNVPMIIEALSVDGSCEQHIESSKAHPVSGKSSVCLSEIYAVVPDEAAKGQASHPDREDKLDASVPESDVN